MWVKSSDCSQVISENWVEACRIGLLNWEKSSFGSVRNQIKEYKAKLEQLQQDPNTVEVKKIRWETKKKLEDLLDSEEVLWKQRAKVQWLSEGDRNTKFFHSQASSRARINEIQGLRDNTGAICSGQIEMGTIVNDYFRTIFRSRKPDDAKIEDVIGVMESRVNPAITQDLCQEFTAQEVKQALFDMFPP